MGGGDPYLNGESAYNTIRGLQSQGVQACAKHLVGNEQEHFRSSSSSNIDERTLREVYLHPFLRSIQANVSSMMCSYNLLNNTYACENSYLLNDILKGEMGFKGYVMSDWGAQHSTVESARSGLDMSMPGDLECCSKHKGEGFAPSFWRGNLTEAIENKHVDAARLKDMCVRILAPYFHLGQDRDDYPSTNFDTFSHTTAANQHVNTLKMFDHAPLIREIAAAGTVLVKNTIPKVGQHRALPLKRLDGQTPNSIALIGSAAGPAFKGANFFGDKAGTDGVVGVGWGSGSADFSILVSPYEALQRRAAQDGTALSWTFDDYAYNKTKAIADERTVDVALVFLQSTSGEEYLTVDGNGGDRNNLTAWHNGDRLVNEVASVNSNTIVVIQNPAQVDVEAFIEHENVTAVIFSHMGGREAGNAVVDVVSTAKSSLSCRYLLIISTRIFLAS
jgi:beta-glucosidase